MTIITGPAWYSPQPDIHICTGGASWAATVIPSDEYLGLASPAEGVWVATGHGQAGVLPTKTAISIDNGSTWAAGGTIANNGTITPVFLTFGNRRLACRVGTNSAISLDQGANWTSTAGVWWSSTNCLKFGGGEFVAVDQTTAFVKKSFDGLSSATFATPAVLSQVFWDDYRSRWLCFESAGLRTWSTVDFITFTLQGNRTLAGASISNYTVAQSDVGTIVVVYGGAPTTGDRSTDGGATWAATGFLGGSQQICLTWGNGGFLANRSLGSANTRSNDDGQTWAASAAMTMTKSWITRWDGINTYLAVGSPGSPDTVANIGVC